MQNNLVQNFWEKLEIVYYFKIQSNKMQLIKIELFFRRIPHKTFQPIQFTSRIASVLHIVITNYP